MAAPGVVQSEALANAKSNGKNARNGTPGVTVSDITNNAILNASGQTP